MEMTAMLVDIGIVVLILISLVIGLIRGFVRESISLATWIAAVGFALLYFKQLSVELPFGLQNEVARFGIAFALIFFGVLVIGSIINYLLTAAVSSVGLGGFDRFLGAIFGGLRGALIIVLIVILMGVTSFPAKTWWIESQLIPHFEEGADWLKQQIPEDFSRYIERNAPVTDAQ